MRRPLLAIFVLSLSAAACSSSKQATSNSTSHTATVAGTDADRLLQESRGANSSAITTGTRTRLPVAQQVSLRQASATQEAPLAADRKVVRNAELQLESDLPPDAQRKIEAVVQSHGGFIVESQQSSSDTRAAGRDIVMITARVPADKFITSLEEIRKTASRVINENIKGEDVTEEFIDVEARLKAQKALEQQFMEIMKRANSVGEALNIQSQLADVRAEVEKIEGRKRFLENQSSLSTIKIRLQTPAALANSSNGFTYRFIAAFSSGFDFALSFILVLVTFLIGALPFAALIGLPLYLLFRYFGRKHNRSLSMRDIAEEELGRT